VRALWATPLGVPGKALRQRWPGGYQARRRRPGNAVPSKNTHPLNIIDFTGYGPSVAGGNRPFPLCSLRNDARWSVVCSGAGRVGLASHVVSVAPRGAVGIVMSEYGRYGGPRFPQLDDDYKVWAVSCRAQLIKEKVWSAVLTDRPASGSDSKGNLVADAWDIMNESALATIPMSVKPVHLHFVTAVSTARDAWDALKDIFEARDNARLLQLMHELSNLKKGGDENIIKHTARAKGLRQELAMLGNQVDENTLVLQILSGLPAEYDKIKTVLENIDGKRNLAHVSAKLLTMEQRGSRGRSSSTTGVKSQAFAASATKKPWDKTAVVCYYCDKKGNMKRDSLKNKADDAKGNRKPNGGRRDGIGGGGAHPRAALAYAASAGQAGKQKAPGSTSGLSTWVLDSGATNHMAAGDKGFTVRTSRSGAKVTLADGHKVSIKGHGYVSMDVGTGTTKARMVLGEAMLVSDLTDNLLSVRAVDRRGGAVVFVGDACYIISDGEAVLTSGVLSNTSVIGSVNESENYVLKVTPVKASASAASTRMDGEAELWHSRFNHFGFENLKRVVGMVDGIPASVADAKRVLGTVCVPYVYSKMARASHNRSTATKTKCELVHTDVDGPLTESLGGSVDFMTLMEDSTCFITATPIKTKGMVPEVIKARITQLETLTGLKVKLVRHDGAKEYVRHDLKVSYENKGITSEKMAPYSSQQNGEAERANRYIMEHARAALLDAGAEKELWAEAPSSVIHVLNPSPKAGKDVTPLEALTGRRPDIRGFLVWGSRAWALKPKQQHRKLDPRTDAGRFAGCTVGGKAYRILEDESNRIFERRDVLMEENSSKTIDKMSAARSSASPRLTALTDGVKKHGAMDMLNAEVPSGDEYAPQQSSECDGAPDKEAVH